MKKLTFTLTILLLFTIIVQGQTPNAPTGKAKQLSLAGQQAGSVLLGLATHQIQNEMKKVPVAALVMKQNNLPNNYTIVYSGNEYLTSNRKYRINGHEIYEFYEGRPVSDLWADDTGFVYGYKSVTEREFFYAARNDKILPEDMEYGMFAFMKIDEKHMLLDNENNPVVGQ
ncbi:MAG TPA: hypothetical protein VEA37_13930, partial [Flavobacterium sp.]|nr:hypothetical protein [Flavobacterium sp.]